MALKFSSTLVVLMSIALILPIYARDRPRDYLKPHNAARAKLGLKHLIWNKTLAEYARNYLNTHVNDCQMVHSDSPYGENLAWGSGDMLPGEAAKMWIDESQYYDYNSNTCASNQICGHYTQVVWRNSMRLGCAKVKCNNGETLISCNYDPPGNYIGEKPY